MSFEEQSLAAHNAKRALHGVPPLTLNRGLCQKAQQWADRMKATGNFSHCPDRNFNGQITGENIAYKMDSRIMDISGDDVTEMWYSEIKDYDFNAHRSRGGVVGHFTQVVWKGSKEMGIGRATDGRGTWYVVGNYLPAGNMMGDDPANVFAPNSGDHSAPDTSGSSRPSGMMVQPGSGGSCGMMMQQTQQRDDGVDHGGKQVVGTNTSKSTRTSIVNGRTTKTTTTTTTYNYSDGSSQKVVNEDVENF